MGSVLGEGIKINFIQVPEHQLSFPDSGDSALQMTSELYAGDSQTYGYPFCWGGA